MKAAIDETNRNDRTEAPFVPSEEWIDAFEKQSNAKGFEEKLKRFARMRANMVAHAGRRVDDFYARELVQDAIEDALAGVLGWDPGRASLEQVESSTSNRRTPCSLYARLVNASLVPPPCLLRLRCGRCHRSMAARLR